MKEILGQYAKIVILMIVIVPILLFLFSTGSGSFVSKMPEPTIKYGNNNSSELVSDISKRKPPTVTIKNFKMTKNQKYQFSNDVFLDYVNQNGNKTNTTLVVKQVIGPDGSEFADPAAEFVARRGVYKVKYQVTEMYKSGKRTTVKSASYLCD